MQDALEQAARAALVDLAHDGSPVVSVNTVDETLSVAWRRWQSFERRSKSRRHGFEDHVEDLAKGLCARFEAMPELVGPLMTDYRFLARVLADVFRTET